MLATSLAVSSPASLYAQTTEGKTPDSNGAGKAPAAATTNPCASGMKQRDQAEILTDTLGADFGPYIAQVVKTVRQNWYKRMPQAVYPPVRKPGRVTVEFVVEKDGRIIDPRVDTSSGDSELDRAALESISATSSFEPLPKEFRGQKLGLRFYYFYNLTPDTTGIYISPCVDVRVPAGSTLQFSVPLGGIERAAVSWSISGLACQKMACGTISETGLYTAPAEVPDPPTVIVEATPKSVKGFPARTQLTVVRAGPLH